MTHSYARIHTNVIAMAQKRVVDLVDVRINEIQEQYIQYAMQRTLLQKLLGKPARNREDAITYCNHTYKDCEYAQCVRYGGKDKSIINSLSRLCELTDDDYINVSSEDADTVHWAVNAPLMMNSPQ